MECLQLAVTICNPFVNGGFPTSKLVTTTAIFLIRSLTQKHLSNVTTYFILFAILFLVDWSIQCSYFCAFVKLNIVPFILLLVFPSLRGFQPLFNPYHWCKKFLTWYHLLKAYCRFYVSILGKSLTISLQ